MTLPHGETLLPTFMPVATQGTMKGLTAAQLEALTPKVSLILNNTYHLSQRPGPDTLDVAGGSHAYQKWNGNLLTDSGQCTSHLSRQVKSSADGIIPRNRRVSNGVAVGHQSCPVLYPPPPLLPWKLTSSYVTSVKLSRVEEEGVLFANPYDPTKTSLLTPERSMQIQHSIGADIMMCVSPAEPVSQL